MEGYSGRILLMLKFIIRTYNQTQKFKTINTHKLWKILIYILYKPSSVWICCLVWFSISYVSVANSWENCKEPGFCQRFGILWLAEQYCLKSKDFFFKFMELVTLASMYLCTGGTSLNFWMTRRLSWPKSLMAFRSSPDESNSHTGSPRDGSFPTSEYVPAFWYNYKINKLKQFSVFSAI
jgi:hypothetical protein